MIKCEITVSRISWQCSGPYSKMHETNTNPVHNTHLNRHPNIDRTLKHTYLLCKPAGVGGEEAPPPAWLDGTDWSIQTGEGKRVSERWREHGGGRCSRRVMWEVLRDICLLILCRILDAKWHYNISVTQDSGDDNFEFWLVYSRELAAVLTYCMCCVRTL